MMKNINQKIPIASISAALLVLVLGAFLWSIVTLFGENNRSIDAFNNFQIFNTYTDSVWKIELGTMKMVHGNYAEGLSISKLALAETAEAAKKLQASSIKNEPVFNEIIKIDKLLRGQYEEFAKSIKKNTSLHGYENNSLHVHDSIYQREIEARLQAVQDSVDQIYLKNLFLEQQFRRQLDQISRTRDHIQSIVVFISILVVMAVIAALIFIYSLRNESSLREMSERIAQDERMKREEIASLNKALIDTQKQLIQSAKLASLGEMAAGVAHELNNPLQFISGYNSRVAKILRETNHETYNSVKEYLDDVARGVERMKNIILSLKDFSRQSTHTLEPIEIDRIIDKSFQLIGEQLRLANIQVQREFKESNHVILGDRIKLEQVFVNLLINAKDAIEARTDGKNGLIEVATKLDNGSIVVEIKDNGCGMTEEIRVKVFDAFFTTKEMGKGTGLGGSISYGIIKEHNGKIECISELNEGATFKITLPIETDH